MVGNRTCDLQISNTGTSLALLTAAIFLLTTPSPSAGGPCDCSTCQSYSDKRSRCLCCVYHGVGGKRSAHPGFFLPAASLFFLTSDPSRSKSRVPANDVGRQSWLPVGEAMTSHPGYRRAGNMAGEFGFEPVLTVKSSGGPKASLGSSDSVNNFRGLIFGDRLDEIATAE
ncbi:hypothetical protein ElyMa_000329900 [Elysia marginata]|uniref:Uncharacterized protein n=1 Tax=Elysia marginata TaxID=1093978 RepID=A0AAV4FAW4_9GAST|nr:hypothetical protein ElyMa_000329900 [Elysia marginata]